MRTTGRWLILVAVLAANCAHRNNTEVRAGFAADDNRPPVEHPA